MAWKRWRNAGVALGLTLALGGCQSLPIPMPDHVPLISCTICSVDHDGTYTHADTDGLLVYGLTITGTGNGEIEGRTDWFLQPKDGGFPSRQSIELPDNMVAGRHYLVVRRVPVGVWSLDDIRWNTDTAHGHTPLMGGRALAVKVAAGTVTYAGDLVVAVAPARAGGQNDNARAGGQNDNHGHSRLSVGGDARMARAELAFYPGLTAPLTVSPLHDMRGKPKSRAR